ncbi:MAG: heme ABC exporter ATP-binding protein CcmA [Nitrospinae bacterium]|nr:heme ABC exporter ATP-binding protein CcmA [Nitrospinota bacterium]
MDWAIQVEQLTKSFGHLLALRGIDLRLRRGKFLTIFGPNGAGKTTLIRILSTLLRPTAGRIEILGMDLRDAGEEIRRQIGVLSHQTFLYNNLTPMENLKFYGTLYGLDHLKERIELLLEQVGLEGRRNDPVRTFSRGMQQRLAIARTLLHDPQVVFLDEPYTGLDQHAARMLEGLLGQMRSGQRTILLVTHNLARGLGMGDEVAIQVGGRILYREERGKIDPASFEERYFHCVEEGPAWDS